MAHTGLTKMGLYTNSNLIDYASRDSLVKPDLLLD